LPNHWRLFTGKTGLEGRKIKDIIYRLKKERKIKRDLKGLYVKA
jgi:hypothetical protein